MSVNSEEGQMNCQNELLAPIGIGPIDGLVVSDGDPIVHARRMRLTAPVTCAIHGIRGAGRVSIEDPATCSEYVTRHLTHAALDAGMTATVWAWEGRVTAEAPRYWEQRRRIWVEIDGFNIAVLSPPTAVERSFLVLLEVVADDPDVTFDRRKR